MQSQHRRRVGRRCFWSRSTGGSTHSVAIARILQRQPKGIEQARFASELERLVLLSCVAHEVVGGWPRFPRIVVCQRLNSSFHGDPRSSPLLLRRMGARCIHLYWVIGIRRHHNNAPTRQIASASGLARLFMFITQFVRALPFHPPLVATVATAGFRGAAETCAERLAVVETETADPSKTMNASRDWSKNSLFTSRTTGG